MASVSSLFGMEIDQALLHTSWGDVYAYFFTYS